MVHFATVCSSWVLINRGTSKRTETNVLGGPRPRHYVRLANVMVSRTALVMLFAICMNLDVILEQPGSSLMFKHFRIEQVLALSSSGGFLRSLRFVSTYMGAFGCPNPKLTMLLGNTPWLERLKRTTRFKKGGSKLSNHIVNRFVDKNGKQTFRGNKVGPGLHPP